MNRDVTYRWPTEGPGFNPWHTDLARFMQIMEDAKDLSFWCVDMELKYLNVRIDTRNNRWILTSDNKNADGSRVRVDPQRVVDAIEKYRGRFTKEQKQ